MYPVVSDIPAVQERYEAMRAEGQSHNMAEMLALRAVPAARTTDDYFRGRNSLVEQYGQARAERVAANLAANGYHVRPGDTYNPTAARFPGDPQAVENRLNGGRDHIRKIAKAREEEYFRKKEAEAKNGVAAPADLVLEEAKKMVSTDERWTRKGVKSKGELREAATAAIKAKIS